MNNIFIYQGISYQDESLNKLIREKLMPETDEWERLVFEFVKQWVDGSEYFEFKTSGSTGTPNVLTFSRVALVASANSTLTFFQLKPRMVALLCLPMMYVAAKMMVVRALVGGLNLLAVKPSSLVEIPNDIKIDFAAMVPLQVATLLNQKSSGFENISTLIIGGASVDDDLHTKLQKVSTTCWETYGMTETLTHVAVRDIKNQSLNNAFKALPSIKFDADERGCLIIHAPNIQTKPLVTNDMVNLLNDCEFEWLGRADWVINSGGIKVSPEQVEKNLANHISVPFAITSLPDVKLGECVVLVLEGGNKLNSSELVKKTNLLSYHVPRKQISIEQLPLLENGKLDRLELRKMVIQLTNTK